MIRDREMWQRCQRLIEVALSQFGRLDFLINNTGWITITPFELITPSFLERAVNIQIAASFLVVTSGFPLLQRQQYDQVIFATSIRVMFIEDTLLEQTGYALGKMTLMVAEEADGIGVNAISPFAATQILGSAPALHGLRLVQVTPGVALFASSPCDVSGVVLRASNGHLSVAQLKRSVEIDVGEAIADQQSAITGA